MELRVLDQVEVAAPCHASWDQMTGDETVRFCEHCLQNVYNLSSMSRKEAEAFVREKEGRACVRFYRRRDGTLLTDNCPVGLRAARRKLVGMWAAWVGAFASLAAWLASGSPQPEPQPAMGNMRLQVSPQPATPEPEHRQVIMGDMAGPVDPPRR